MDAPIGVQLTVVEGPMALGAHPRAAFEVLAGPSWRDPVVGARAAPGAQARAGSNPGRTTLPHVERQRLGGDGSRVVAARACFRRPEQEDSKSNSSRTPGPSRALSQSR
jgi:hypothetical protein